MKVPASVRAVAKDALALRDKYDRGGLTPAEAKRQGIDSGVTRARRLASGNVTRHDIDRMRAFFSRNQRYRNHFGESPPSNAEIAWKLWGGDPGEEWVTSMGKTEPSTPGRMDLSGIPWLYVVGGALFGNGLAKGSLIGMGIGAAAILFGPTLSRGVDMIPSGGMPQIQSETTK